MDRIRIVTSSLAKPQRLGNNGRMNEPLAYLNGQWIPASAAAVPVADAGLVLGATVTEQLRTFGGRLFRLDDHLARLEQSLQIIGVDPGLTLDGLAAVARELTAKNHSLLASGDDLGLSIFVTPGAYPAFSPPLPSRPRPTVCMHTYLLPFRFWAHKYRTGQALVTTDIRQVPHDTWPPALKCRSRMHYYLADRDAAKVDPHARALLLDHGGRVTETSTANLLIFRSSEGLISPPGERILHGISLSVLMELAGKLGITTVERDLTQQDVASADEVLICSTSLCLLSVTRFDGRPIGDGRPGGVFHRLLAAWSELVGLDISAQAARFAERV